MRARLPTHPVHRRRLAALGAACLAALVVGASVGAGADAPQEAPGPEPGGGGPAAAAADRAERLTLRQLVGQVVVLRFDGGERPTYVADALRRAEVAGAILFGDNVASAEQVRRLTRSLQRAAGRSALIAVDQEGGSIRSVPFAPPEPSPATLTRAAEAERFARRGARALAGLGINVNLAPVADVASVPGSVMAGRAYPGDADAVARLARAAVRGTRQGEVAATAKHFPGLGAATANTDDAAVTIDRTRRELERVELEPFRAAVEAEVPLVMAGHALYPALDEARIASQSPAVLSGLLRDELGYEGVIVTDSMEAEAVLSRSSTPTAALAALEAGADLLLTTSTGSYMPVFARILRRARRDEGFRARVEEAAERVLALKRELGLRLPRPATG